MDHGTLTDNNGRKADFRNIVLVMTTNAGAQEMSRASIGFTQQDHSTDGMAIIKKSFCTGIPKPAGCHHPVRCRSTRIRLRGWSTSWWSNWRASSVRTTSPWNWTTPPGTWIADRGYDPKMGARPMARVIQEHIKRPLAEELLFGKLAEGGHVRISVGDDGGLKLNAEPNMKELAHLPDK